MDPRHLDRRGSVVLARLAVAGGGTVSHRSLADAVWGEPLPASWQPAVRNVIARVRRGLDSAGRLECLHVRADVAAAERHLQAGEPVPALPLAERAAAAAAHDVLPGRHEQWVETLRMDVAAL